MGYDVHGASYKQTLEQGGIDTPSINEIPFRESPTPATSSEV
jgi:hypothetical protein